MFSVRRAQDVRLAIRAALVCATAFGLQLSAEQIAAVMLAAEAVLRLLVSEKPQAADVVAE